MTQTPDLLRDHIIHLPCSPVSLTLLRHPRPSTALGTSRHFRRLKVKFTLLFGDFLRSTPLRYYTNSCFLVVPTTHALLAVVRFRPSWFQSILRSPFIHVTPSGITLDYRRSGNHTDRDKIHVMFIHNQLRNVTRILGKRLLLYSVSFHFIERVLIPLPSRN